MSVKIKRKRNNGKIYPYIYFPIHNKAYYEYYKLIIYARKQNRNIRISDTYSENHHIIPWSLGGSNNDYNIIRLTYEEHIKAHLLLEEMFPINSTAWKNMHYAIKQMSGKKYHKILLEKIYCVVPKRNTKFYIITSHNNQKFIIEGMNNFFRSHSNIIVGLRKIIAKQRKKYYRNDN